MIVSPYFILSYDSESTATSQSTGNGHFPKLFLNEFTFLVKITLFSQVYSKQAIF